MDTTTGGPQSIAGSFDADVVILRFRGLLQEAFQSAEKSGVKRPVGIVLLADGQDETATNLVRALCPEQVPSVPLHTTTPMVGCLAYREIAGALRRISPRDNDALLESYAGGDADAWNLVVMFGSLTFIGPVSRAALFAADPQQVLVAALASGELAPDILLSEVSPAAMHRQTLEWVPGANPQAGKGWLCMHRYLPSPLPDGWNVESHRADGAVLLSVDGFIVILSGLRKGRHRLVHVTLGTDDDHTTDADANTILSQLRGVRRFREQAGPPSSRDMPPARNYLAEIE